MLADEAIESFQWYPFIVDELHVSNGDLLDVFPSTIHLIIFDIEDELDSHRNLQRKRVYLVSYLNQTSDMLETNSASCLLHLLLSTLALP